MSAFDAQSLAIATLPVRVSLTARLHCSRNMSGTKTTRRAAVSLSVPLHGGRRCIVRDVNSPRQGPARKHGRSRAATECMGHNPPESVPSASVNT